MKNFSKLCLFLAFSANIADIISAPARGSKKSTKRSATKRGGSRGGARKGASRGGARKGRGGSGGSSASVAAPVAAATVAIPTAAATMVALSDKPFGPMTKEETIAAKVSQINSILNDTEIYKELTKDMAFNSALKSLNKYFTEKNNLQDTIKLAQELGLFNELGLDSYDIKIPVDFDCTNLISGLKDNFADSQKDYSLREHNILLFIYALAKTMSEKTINNKGIKSSILTNTVKENGNKDEFQIQETVLKKELKDINELKKSITKDSSKENKELLLNKILIYLSKNIVKSSSFGTKLDLKNLKNNILLTNSPKKLDADIAEAEKRINFLREKKENLNKKVSDETLIKKIDNLEKKKLLQNEINDLKNKITNNLLDENIEDAGANIAAITKKTTDINEIKDTDLSPEQQKIKNIIDNEKKLNKKELDKKAAETAAAEEAAAKKAAKKKKFNLALKNISKKENLIKLRKENFLEENPDIKEKFESLKTLKPEEKKAFNEQLEKRLKIGSDKKKTIKEAKAKEQESAEKATGAKEILAAQTPSIGSGELQDNKNGKKPAETEGTEGTGETGKTGDPKPNSDTAKQQNPKAEQSQLVNSDLLEL